MRNVTYFKRLRMERDLFALPPPVALPPGFGWVAWDESLVDDHADVMVRSFAGELDATVFPNFASPSGCRLILRAIRDAAGFCPAATWLVAGPGGYAGMVQGLVDGTGYGAIQNLAVLPDARGRRLGWALLHKSLSGFRAGGATRACLDVTARNAAAVRLYRRFGFRSYKTTYRAVERPDPAPVGVGL